MYIFKFLCTIKILFDSLKTSTISATKISFLLAKNCYIALLFHASNALKIHIKNMGLFGCTQNFATCIVQALCEDSKDDSLTNLKVLPVILQYCFTRIASMWNLGVVLTSCIPSNAIKESLNSSQIDSKLGSNFLLKQAFLMPHSALKTLTNGIIVSHLPCSCAKVSKLLYSFPLMFFENLFLQI